MKIAVTGGNGRLGSEAVRFARGRGHDVVVLDRFGDDAHSFIRLDLTDFAAVDAAIGSGGFDAVVHLAGMPGRTQAPGDVIFHNNMLASYNVLTAARRAGTAKIVYASSETILGLPFDASPPYLPVDEDTPDSFSSDYGLVKFLEERIARQLAGWNPELSITGIVLTTITLPELYEAFPGYETAPGPRGYNLWSYTDVRDAGQGVVLAAEYSVPGFERIILAADDTVMSRPTAELVSEFHPGTPVRGQLAERGTLFSNEKAKRLLGFAPRHSWRDSPAG
jgi:nucleoside-diphosphate-sugar epimerase